MKRFRGEQDEFFALIPDDSPSAQATLPEDHQDGSLDDESLDPVYQLMRSLETRQEAVPENSAPAVPLAVAAYTVARATRVAAEGAAIVGIVIGLLSLLAVH